MSDIGLIHGHSLLTGKITGNYFFNAYDIWKNINDFKIVTVNAQRKNRDYFAPEQGIIQQT